jgi:hypothetical protein
MSQIFSFKKGFIFIERKGGVFGAAKRHVTE